MKSPKGKTRGGKNEGNLRVAKEEFKKKRVEGQKKGTEAKNGKKPTLRGGRKGMAATPRRTTKPIRWESPKDQGGRSTIAEKKGEVAQKGSRLQALVENAIRSSWRRGKSQILQGAAREKRAERPEKKAREKKKDIRSYLGSTSKRGGIGNREKKNKRKGGWEPPIQRVFKGLR